MHDGWFDESGEEETIPSGLVPTPIRPALDDAYDRAIRAAARNVGRLLAQREGAPALWAEIAGLPQARRLLLVTNIRRYQTWGFFDLLLRRSRDPTVAGSLAAVEAAELALAVAGHLGHYLTLGQIADCRAAARGAMSEGYRLLGQYDRARACLAEAFATGSEDHLQQDRLLLSRAAYLEEVGRYALSIRAYGEAATRFRARGAVACEAEARLRQAGVLGHLAPGSAVLRTRSVLPLLRCRRPRLELAAFHQMAWFANDAGRPRLALQVFERAEPLYAVFDDATARLQRTWLQGRIARARGDLEDAERHLLRAWYAFGDLEMAQDLMLCGLDLLEVYALGGRSASARRLSRDFRRDLKAWGFGPEVRDAWLAATACTTRHGFARLALHIRRSWHRFSDEIGLDES